jgi:hypothetical protein
LEPKVVLVVVPQVRPPPLPPPAGQEAPERPHFPCQVPSHCPRGPGGLAYAKLAPAPFFSCFSRLLACLQLLMP